MGKDKLTIYKREYVFNMRGFTPSHALERHPVKTEKTEYKIK